MLAAALNDYGRIFRCQSSVITCNAVKDLCFHEVHELSALLLSLCIVLLRIWVSLTFFNRRFYLPPHAAYILAFSDRLQQGLAVRSEGTEDGPFLLLELIFQYLISDRVARTLCACTNAFIVIAFPRTVLQLCLSCLISTQVGQHALNLVLYVFPSYPEIFQIGHFEGYERFKRFNPVANGCADLGCILRAVFGRSQVANE